jgi:predicted nucleic acid-binding protein
VEAIRHRGDAPQALRLSRWLDRLTREYTDAILAFDADAAQVWGRLRVPNPENPLDKQVAATALIHDLAGVTRNTAHYAQTGVRVLDPFA